MYIPRHKTHTHAHTHTHTHHTFLASGLCLAIRSSSRKARCCSSGTSPRSRQHNRSAAVVLVMNVAASLTICGKGGEIKCKCGICWDQSQFSHCQHFLFSIFPSFLSSPRCKPAWRRCEWCGRQGARMWLCTQWTAVRGTVQRVRARHSRPAPKRKKGRKKRGKRKNRFRLHCAVIVVVVVVVVVVTAWFWCVHFFHLRVNGRK